MIWLNRLWYWVAGVDRRCHRSCCPTGDRRNQCNSPQARAAWAHYWKDYDRRRNRRVALHARRIRDRHRVFVAPLKRTDWTI